MSIVYVDEYEPSSAFVKLQDPIYKVSKDNETIQVRKLGVPSIASYLLPFLVVGGVVVAYWLFRK